MDEPTADLTDHEIEILFKILRKLREKGVAIIYISHRMSDLDAIVDTVSVLRDGHLISTRPYEKNIKDTLVKEMVGRDLTQQFPERPPYKRGRESLTIENLSSGSRLKNISFSAYEGEVLGIVGLMGGWQNRNRESYFWCV